MLKSEKKKYPKILASIAFSNYFSPHTLIISSVIRIVFFKRKILLGVEQIWWLPSKILPISLNQQSFTLKTDNSFLLSLLLFCTNQPIPADYCRPFGGGYYWDCCTWRLLNGGQALYLLCPAASIMLGTSFLYFENIFYYCFLIMYMYVYVYIWVQVLVASRWEYSISRAEITGSCVLSNIGAGHKIHVLKRSCKYSFNCWAISWPP